MMPATIRVILSVRFTLTTPLPGCEASDVGSDGNVGPRAENPGAARAELCVQHGDAAVQRLGDGRNLGTRGAHDERALHRGGSATAAD